MEESVLEDTTKTDTIDQVLDNIDLSALPEESDLKSAAVSNEETTDLYDETTETPTKITYSTKDKNMQVEYVSQDTGMKENIVLNEKPDSNVFLYDLNLKGIVPRMNPLDGGITFYDKETGDIVGSIEAPFMNDATNNAYSQDLHYTLGQKEGEEDSYVLALTVSEDYLSSSDRAYPVTIDPTFTWNGSEEISDVYVINKSPYTDTNFYSSGVTTFSVGYGSQGLFRTYLRFKDFTKTIDNKYIDSANLTLYETDNGGSGGVVEAHRLLEEWGASSLTWTNRPDYATAVYDSYTTKGTKGTAQTLDITNHAREIANGTYTSFGIMLRNKDESSSGVYSQYYSSRCSNNAYKPKLSIVYYDGPTIASSVTVNDQYIKPGTLTTVNWAGISSHSLKRVEYRLATYDSTNTNVINESYIPYSSSTLIGTTSAGSKTVSGSNTWPAGCYRIFVRGVDNGGIVGTGKGATVYVDGTAPTLSSASISGGTSATDYSNLIPTISWTASDANFQQVEYSINGGAYKLAGTAVSGSSSLDSTAFTSAGKYTINIRAKDKADNYSAAKIFDYYYDKAVPVIGGVSTDPATTSELYSKSATPTLKWTNITDKLLSKIDYSINDSTFVDTKINTSNGSIAITSGKISTPGKYNLKIKATDSATNSSTQSVDYYFDNVKPIVNTVSLTPTTQDTSYTSNTQPIIKWDISDFSFKRVEYSLDDKNYTAISTASSGSYQFPKDIFTQSKVYTIYFRAIDKADNKSDDGGTKIKLLYYCDPKAPVITSVTITPTSASGDVSYNNTPLITWNVSENTARMEYSINGSTYALLGTTAAGSRSLSSDLFKTTGKYSINIRAINKAGLTSSVTPLEYYYEEPFKGLEVYNPIDPSSETLTGYKNIINWNRNSTNKLPSAISYEIYRGDYINFTPSEENLVASDIKDDYWSDLSVNNSQVFYKIRAVVKYDGVVRAYGDYADYILTNTKKIDPNRRLGNVQNLGYQSISLPMGSGSIEKSQGNVAYSQTDVTLPNPQLQISLTRDYNSGNETVGMFGLGWDLGMNVEIMKQIGSDGAVNLIYKDETGALFVFKKNANGIYTCDKATELKLTVVNAPTSLTVENGTEKGTYPFVVAYELKTKDNNIYRFNSGGQIVSITDLSSNFNLFTYDQKDGKLLKIISNSGQFLSFDYGTTGRTVKEIKLADNTTLKYSYIDNKLMSVTRKDNSSDKAVVYQYSYDQSTGLLTDIIDAEQNYYNLSYTDGKATTYAQPNGDYFEVVYADPTYTTVTKNDKNDHAIYSEYSFYDTETGNVKEEYSIIGNVNKNEEGTDNPKEKHNLIKYAYDNQENPNKYLLTTTTRQEDYATVEGNVITFGTKDRISTIKYDANSNVEKEIDEQGNTTDYSYDTKNNAALDMPSSIIEKDAGNVETSNESLQYDDFGNQTSSEDKVDKSKSDILYDEDGNNITQTTETNIGLNAGVENYIDIDANGNEKTSNLTSGTVSGTTTNVYYDNGLLKNSTDANTGIVTNYEYDLLGRVTKTQYVIPDGSKSMTEEESKAYDNNGSLISETDRAGVTTSYQYDSMNRLVVRTITKDNLSVSYTTAYSYVDKVEIYTGSGTQEILNAYVETETNNEGYITSQKYFDNFGRLVREKKNGIYTDYTYDKQGKIRTSFLIGEDEKDISKGKLTLNLYDEKGNNTYQILNPIFKSDKFIIDDKETIATISEYDSLGNVTHTTSGLGYKTDFGYDATSRLTSVTMPDGTDTPNITSYQYDSVNDVDKTVKTTTINALGQISESIENAAGQLLSVKDVSKQKNSIQISYTYDNQGRKATQVYSNGDYQKFDYDAKQRLESITNYRKDNTKVSKTKYTYDIYDNINAMIDYKYQGSSEVQYHYTRYAYDALKRLIGFYETNGTTIPSEDDFDNHKIIYHYDIENNLDTITYQDSLSQVKELSFTYTPDKWLDKIYVKVQDGSEVKTNLLRDYTYYNDGKVEYIIDNPDFLNGGTKYILKKYEYDVFDRVEHIKYANESDPDTIFEAYDYTYDKDSNILTEKLYKNYLSSIDKLDTLKEYIYDPMGRLEHTKITDNLKESISNIDYSFDKVGNRKSMVVEDSAVITTTDYQYNDLNQLTSSITTNKEKETGTKTTTSQKTYGYDDNGNQTSETDSITKESTTSTYDVNNQLTKLVKKTNNIITLEQNNEYNGSGQRIRKTENGNITNYYYQDGVVLYTTDGSNKKTSFNLYGTSKNVIATIRYSDSGDSSSYLYNKDVHTSITSIINKDNQGVIGYIYDDYGQTEATGEIGFYNEICYTGGIYDKSTGLYYLNARYYNPEDGRFITKDSYRGDIKDPNSLHLYTYCANNPINYMDPSGHIIDTLFDIASFGSSVYDFVKNPSWGNAGYIAWDVGAAVVPGVPGSYTAKGAKVIKKGAKLLKGKKKVKAVSKSKSKLKSFKIHKGSSKTNFGKIKKIIKKGKVKGNNIISKIDDNTQAIFRRDTGVNAHSIRSHGYDQPVNHYNVEIQTKTAAGKWKSKWSYHIILDKKGNIINFFD